MRAAILLALVCALGACGPQTSQPNVEMNYVEACEARGASSTFCACLWDSIETNVAVSDFVSLERLPAAERDAHPVMAEINTYAEQCNAADAQAD